MKKTLVAIAALAAATGAMAQSSVTLYGTMDAGYSNFGVVNNGVNSGKKQSVSGGAFSADDTSRWGMKGTDDVGGGVKAGFNIESQLSSNPRAAMGYNQNASVGAIRTTTPLQPDFLYNNGNATSGGASGFGPQATKIGDRAFNVTLTSGQHDLLVGYGSSLVRANVVSYQADGSNLVGNLIANDGVLTAGPGSNENSTAASGGALGLGRNNSITYGFTQGAYKVNLGYIAGYQFAQNGQANITGGGRGVQAAGSYNQGPLSATLTYSDAKFTNATAGASNQDVTVKVAGASYDLGVAKVYGQYARINSVDTGTAAATAGSSGDAANIYDRKLTSLGVRYPFGRAWAFAQYSKGNGSSGFASDGYGTTATASGLTYATTSGYRGDMSGQNVGVKYEFSKSTRAYAMYGRTSIATSATDTTKTNQTSFGLVTNF